MDSYLTNNHPRVRSFLSPTNKYGQRSLSTSDSHHYFSRVDLHATNHNSIYKRDNHQKIKLDDYRKTQNVKPTKLEKCLNKNKLSFENTKNDWDRSRHENNQDSNLQLLIRQLKGKASKLEAENTELRRKQQGDLEMIRRQNETIIMLREVLSNQTSKLKQNFSFDRYMQEMNILQQVQNSFEKNRSEGLRNQLGCSQCRQIQFSSQRVHEMAFEKLKEERNSLREQYRSLLIKYEEQKHELTKKQNCKGCSSSNQGLFSETLMRLREERNKQLDEIDNVLFSSKF